MSEKHSKKRGNNNIEEESHVHPSISASTTTTAVASPASANLSRKKTKVHADEEDLKLTHPNVTAIPFTGSHPTATASTSTESKEKQGKGIHHTTSATSSTLDYHPLTLADIRNRIIDLCPLVPTIPEGGLSEDGTAVYDWASKTQTVIEEFNLLLCCVSPATYKWASDRSGAADQNLSVLSGELGNAQEQISTCLSQRISNVLAPVVDLVAKSTIVHEDPETGIKTKTNTFAREVVDPSFLKLNCTILSRNAKMLRQVILANFHKAATCIKDYLDAAQKDNHNDHQRSFAY